MPALLSRRDTSYPALIPLLTGLFGALLFICLLGLLWCFVRRKKHRAPVIPYHLHTLPPPAAAKKPGATQAASDSGVGASESGGIARAAGAGEEEGTGAEDGAQEGAAEERERAAKKERKAKRHSVLGQEGRGVGYGFNPIFREAYGGGGGAESGVEGGMAAARVSPRWG